jgi:hypothetical protein
MQVLLTMHLLSTVNYGGPYVGIMFQGCHLV